MSTTLSPMPAAVPAAPSRRRRRRWPAITLIVAGVALLLGAQAWRSFAVPALVKFPTDIDQQLRYEGTFEQYVDAATAAPLSEPATAALTIERRVEALPDESDAEAVVARESIVTSVVGLPATTQVHQYVMDRSTNANIADPRAWGFDESTVLDRTDSYWLAMPRDVDGMTTVQMYSDDIATTYQAEVGRGTEISAGLVLVPVEVSVPATPLADGFLGTLDQAVTLPRSLSFEQLEPSLRAAGIPVDEAVTTLLAVATPDELTTLAALVAEPIPLEYVTSFTGSTLVEPDTGAIVDVRSVVQRVSARPAGDSVGTLLAILDAHRTEPIIAAAIAGFDALADEPLPVFEYRYAETPASVADMAAWVSTQIDRKELAERTIPLGLSIAGVVALVGGLGLLVRSRRGGAT